MRPVAAAVVSSSLGLQLPLCLESLTANEALYSQATPSALRDNYLSICFLPLCLSLPLPGFSELHGGGRASFKLSAVASGTRGSLPLLLPGLFCLDS